MSILTRIQQFFSEPINTSLQSERVAFEALMQSFEARFEAALQSLIANSDHAQQNIALRAYVKETEKLVAECISLVKKVV